MTSLASYQGFDNTLVTSHRQSNLLPLYGPEGRIEKLYSSLDCSNAFTGVSHLPNFDLSRNKSLHTLEIMAESVDRLLKDRSPETASESLNYALSTIKSLVSYRALLMYQEHDFCGVGIRLRSAYTMCHQLREGRKHCSTTGDSNYCARCTKYGVFGWSCVRTIGRLWGSTQCKR